MYQVLEPNIFPSTQWMQQALQNETIYFNKNERYERQTYRNRYQIYTAQSIVALSIPVINESTKDSFYDVKISYREKWMLNHWRTIVSAYKNAPYFEYFEAELGSFFKFETENLWDLIYQTNQWIFDTLQIPYQTEFVENDSLSTLRVVDSKTPEPKPYYQVFNNRHGFQKNLSVLDLIFHCGNDSIDFLSQ